MEVFMRCSCLNSAEKEEGRERDPLITRCKDTILGKQKGKRSRSLTLATNESKGSTTSFVTDIMNSSHVVFRIFSKSWFQRRQCKKDHIKASQHENTR